jgi:cytochrome c-type biogenesis protein CcmH/NrfG
MIAATQEPARRVELLDLLAKLHERRLNDFDAAFDAYCRALRVDPSNQDVIAHIDRLAESSGRWADLAAVYDAEIDRILDTRLQTEMLLRLARIYEEETHDLDKAIAT